MYLLSDECFLRYNRNSCTTSCKVIVKRLDENCNGFDNCVRNFAIPNLIKIYPAVLKSLHAYRRMVSLTELNKHCVFCMVIDVSKNWYGVVDSIKACHISVTLRSELNFLAYDQDMRDAKGFGLGGPLHSVW